MIWFVFALALLAGMGAAAWRTPRGLALYWTRMGTAGALTMAAAGLGCWLFISPATQTGVYMRSIGGAFALAGPLLLACGRLPPVRPAYRLRYPGVPPMAAAPPSLLATPADAEEYPTGIRRPDDPGIDAQDVWTWPKPEEVAWWCGKKMDPTTNPQKAFCCRSHRQRAYETRLRVRAEDRLAS